MDRIYTQRRLENLLLFIAWKEDQETAIALGHPYSIDGFDYFWFNMAINCDRDGDMGQKDAHGVYERKWRTDSVELNKVRPATPDEVELYLRYFPKLGKRSLFRYDCGIFMQEPTIEDYD